MRAVGKGHARDGCIAHGETVHRVVFHFSEANESRLRGWGAGGEWRGWRVVGGEG